MRTDKLTLAAIEATVANTENPVQDALHIDVDRLRERSERLAGLVSGTVVAHDGRVGGREAPAFPFPGWAVEMPEETAPARCASATRQSSPEFTRDDASSTCAASPKPMTI